MPRQAARSTKLTKTFVENLKPEAKRYRVMDTAQTGFCVLVSPAGKRTFAVRYVTAEGKNSEKTLGEYPALLPDKARELAAEVRTEVKAKGADPVEQTREKRRAGTERRQRTLEALSALYLKHAEAKGKKSASTLSKERGHLGKNILPRLGKLSVDGLTLEDIEGALADIKKSAAARSGGTGAAAANDCRKYLNLILEFGRKRGWLTVNPVQDTDKYEERHRERVASDEELRLLWHYWDAQKRTGTAEGPEQEDEAGRGWTSASALQFEVLTLQRGGEVAALRWEEIDFEGQRWYLGASRKKERRAFIVPLSPQALAILREAHAVNGDAAGPFMGKPNSRTGKRNTIRRDSLTQAFERACEKLGIAGLTPHDMRRTGRTRMTDGERLNIAPHVAEVVIAHKVSGKIQKVYDQNEYLAEKRAALDAWANYVERVARGEPGVVRSEGNVVALNGR